MALRGKCIGAVCLIQGVSASKMNMEIKNIIRPAIKAITIEIVLILISFLAVQASGGHSGMMVAMALHVPTSILGVIVVENIKLNVSPELFFHMVTSVTIILHVCLLTTLFIYIQKRNNIIR